MERADLEGVIQAALRRRMLENRGMLPPSQLMQLGRQLTATLIEPEADLAVLAQQFVTRGLVLASVQEAGTALLRAQLEAGQHEAALAIAERLAKFTVLFGRAEAELLRHEQEQLRAAVVLALENQRLENQRRRTEYEEGQQEQARLVALVNELSTPIVPVYDGILVLPLIGTIDTHRAQEIMARLLSAITDGGADCVIIDITGVLVVDTGVIQYLLQTARAAGLLGATVVLVGISPEIAQTITQLGIHISEVPTLNNLQVGINYALRQRGLAIQPLALAATV